MFLCVAPKKERKRKNVFLICPPTHKNTGLVQNRNIFSSPNFYSEDPRNKTFRKSLADKCFIHLIDVKGTTFPLIVDLSPEPDFSSVYLISVLSLLVSVLRFIKGTFPTNYIPTIEDTYRQVS